MKIIFKLILLLTFFSTQITAQDEDCPACGFYVDGVKTESITCYNFDKLTIVLPYNSGMNGYDKVNVHVYYDPKGKKAEYTPGNTHGYKSVPGSAIKTIVKGNYIVVTIFSNDVLGGEKADLWGSFEEQWDRTPLWKENLPKKKKAKADAPVPTIGVCVEGATVTEIKETYDPVKKALVKKPVYATNKHSKNYFVACEGINTDQCTNLGTKVDFNNLGK